MLAPLFSLIGPGVPPLAGLPIAPLFLALERLAGAMFAGSIAGTGYARAIAP